MSLECNHVVEFPKTIGIGSWKVKPCGGSRENRPNCALEVREFLGNALGVCPCCGVPKNHRDCVLEVREFLKPALGLC